jgi:neutral ceramidase
MIDVGAASGDSASEATMRSIWSWTFVGGLLGQAIAGCPVEASPEVESNLKAGVAKVDITPPPDTPVTGHPRKTSGVRDPIRAGVLLLDDGKTKAAIASFDLIGASDALVKTVRGAVTSKTGVPRENILVAASHNHSGPDFDKEAAWSKQVAEKVAAAASEASSDMRPVTVGYGEDTIGFGINRRKVINGRAVVRLNPAGPNDRRVKVLRFDDGRSLNPIAVLMHAVCHPCFFTWGDNATPPYPEGYPKMSADFPGEAQGFVEKVYDGQTRTLFLQGCAGDIRPNLPGDPYRCADEADIQWAGRDLGGAVVRALARSMIREERLKRPAVYKVRCASERATLPGKDGPVEAELMALKIGPYLLLTMPGEPMVEYSFKVERSIADRAIPIVVGYANGDVGYIATAEAHKYGGYEPIQSPLLPAAEAVILSDLDRLADRVVGDVFESFSKHPPGTKLRTK